MVSPIGLIEHGEILATYNDGEIGEITLELYDTLSGILNGSIDDPFGWTLEV